ncbi:hypothetical protein AAMO2058_000432000 [Amorphochlora amoebiformis]
MDADKSGLSGESPKVAGPGVRRDPRSSNTCPSGQPQDINVPVTRRHRKVARLISGPMSSQLPRFFRGRNLRGYIVEAFKLSLLISLPVGATLFFDLPQIKRAVIMNRQYIVYPPEEQRDEVREIASRVQPQRKIRNEKD